MPNLSRNFEVTNFANLLTQNWSDFAKISYFAKFLKRAFRGNLNQYCIMVNRYIDFFIYILGPLKK